MNTLNTWICDSCGGAIEKAEDGWVEWINLGISKPGRDLKLVHRTGTGPHKDKGGCMFNQRAEFAKDEGTVADLHLTAYLGSDGLMNLLSFISESRLPTQQVLEMIKRLHIPGYEHARQHFRAAINAGVFEPNTEDNYYSQSEIEATLRYVAQEN